MAFNPNQPRDPKGTDTGGQFASASGATTPGHPDFNPDLVDAEEFEDEEQDEEAQDEAAQEEAEIEELDRIHNESIQNALTRDEINSFARYTSDNYKDINGGLRGLHELRPEDINTIRKIDTAFDKISLSDDIEAFRALSPNTLSKMKDGAIFTDPGYTSSTFSEKQANDFRGDDGTPARIIIPKGSKAIPVNRWSNYPEEMEVVVDRGARYQVARQGDNVTLTLLGHG